MRTLEERVRYLEWQNKCCKKQYFGQTEVDFPEYGQYDVLYVSISSGLIYVWDGQEYRTLINISDSFLSLSGTPDSYEGNSGKYISVKDDESSLQFDSEILGSMSSEDSDSYVMNTQGMQNISKIITLTVEEFYNLNKVYEEGTLYVVPERKTGVLAVSVSETVRLWGKPTYYLHFPGESGSYVEARDIRDFEIGDQDSEIEFSLSFPLNMSRTAYLMTTGPNSYLSNTSGWILGGAGNSFSGSSITDEQFNKVRVGDVDFGWTKVNNGHFHLITWEYKSSYGQVNLYHNGHFFDSYFNPNMIGNSIPNNRPLKIAFSADGGGYPEFKLSYFRFNDEEFFLNEGSGNTISGNKGTILDIVGNVSWAEDII